MIDEQNNIQETDPETEPFKEDPTSPEEIKTADKDIEIMKARLQEADEKFLRLYAEFDNFRRRTIKEKIEILQTAGKEVMLALLPVIDDFERAQKAAESTRDYDAYKEGIDLIHQKFNSILQARGLKTIESLGMEFNVDQHEAITNIPAASEDMKGKVVDETEKGYTLNGHVIRFAKVIVGE